MSLRPGRSDVERADEALAGLPGRALASIFSRGRVGTVMKTKS